MKKYIIELVIELEEEPNSLQWIPDSINECLEDNESIIKWRWDDYTEKDIKL